MKPLPKTEQRNEILIFRDGSEIELNAQMRRDCKNAYKSALKAAVNRRIVEAKNGPQ